MSGYLLVGRHALRGEVRVSGAKNSITKLMVASMLTNEPCIFTTPHIGDSQITRAICEALGAEFGRPAAYPVRAHPAVYLLRGATRCESQPSGDYDGGPAAPYRASRHSDRGRRRPWSTPGQFSPRGLSRGSVRMWRSVKKPIVKAEHLSGAEIVLPYPSVTTTENLPSRPRSPEPGRSSATRPSSRRSWIW